MLTILSVARSLWKVLVVILTPLLLLPVTLLIEGPEARCAYVMLIMAIFWLTEALPIDVTSLLPVFMFPVVGVMSASDVAAAFFNSTSLMFIGGMIVAVAIEEWNIHRRIALKLLLILGSKPAWLLLGLMLTAWFLSMWISNTATTAMMLPIATAILNQLKTSGKQKQKGTDDDDAGVELLAVKKLDQDVKVDFNDAADVQINVTTGKEMNGVVEGIQNNVDETDKSDTIKDNTPDDESWKQLCKALTLCICYAANIGGTATMTGSTPNLVLKGQLEMVYGKMNKTSPVTFGKWMAFGIPTTFVMILLSWLWLNAYFLRSSGWSSCCGRKDKTDESAVRKILKEQYKKLGSLSFGQIAVLFHLALIVLLWITRDMGNNIGWARFFKDKFIRDSVPAIFVGCLLFIFPSELPKFSHQNISGSKRSHIKPLLSWKTFNTKMPWGIVFLLGGGFAMAKASEVSGLSAWIGNQLTSLTHLHPWVLNLVLCFIVAAFTEFTSNTATTSLILPILADLSRVIGLEPWYLMFSAATAAGFAFMLPIATPPNAVVFSYGFVKVIDMVKSGFLLNVIAVCVLVASNEFLGRALFQQSV